MTPRDVGKKYAASRRKLREKLALLVPTTVTFYPFEVFVASLGLLIGIPLLLGLAAPTSLVLLLPKVVYWLYSSGLVIGGTTLAMGLRNKKAPAMSSGLQLLGGSFIVYALCTLAVVGFAGAAMAFVAFTLLGAVCIIRAHHFRRLLDIQRGATRIGSP